jgi:hypothetical protein
MFLTSYKPCVVSKSASRNSAVVDVETRVDIDEETVVYVPHIANDTNIATQIKARLEYLQSSKFKITDKYNNLESVMNKYNQILDNDDQNVLTSELNIFKGHILCIDKELNKCNYNWKQYLRAKTEVYKRILDGSISQSAHKHIKSKMTSMKQCMSD